jgi:hypothetical protein
LAQAATVVLVDELQSQMKLLTTKAKWLAKKLHQTKN